MRQAGSASWLTGSVAVGCRPRCPAACAWPETKPSSLGSPGRFLPTGPRGSPYSLCMICPCISGLLLCWHSPPTPRPCSPFGTPGPPAPGSWQSLCPLSGHTPPTLLCLCPTLHPNPLLSKVLISRYTQRHILPSEAVSFSLTVVLQFRHAFIPLSLAWFVHWESSSTRAGAVLAVAAFPARGPEKLSRPPGRRDAWRGQGSGKQSWPWNHPGLWIFFPFLVVSALHAH